jgi:hypothetical protein
MAPAEGTVLALQSGRGWLSRRECRVPLVSQWRENRRCAFAAVAAPLRRHERERIGWALGLLLVVHLI